MAVSMDQEARTIPPAYALGLLGLTLALLLLRIGSLPLLGPDEPRYTRVAVEMARSGDWVTPTLQGKPWLEKPILYYWMAGAAFRMLGETDVAARLPSILATLLLVGATALCGARLYGAAAGWNAGFIVATSLLPFVYGHAASMDMLLAATVTAGMVLFVLAHLGIAGPLARIVGAGFFGLAVLAKGPLGVLLPGLVLVVYLLLTRDLRPPTWKEAILGALVFLAVAGPWYALVYQAQGQAFIDTFILNHNVSRFTSTVHNHPGPVVYYLPILIGGMLPWSLLLWRAARGVRRSVPADMLIACWALAPLAFFSLAGSKLPGYILPVVPPLAILLGRTAAAASATRLRWMRAVAVVVIVAVALIAPPLVAARESGRDLFAPAEGRPVLAWGAWRTAWMAGYFYNDARVREISGMEELSAAVAAGPTLVLCGPGERRRLESSPGWVVRVLSVGPRANALLQVRARP
jgi:4-amino-4-deoxy-L-arabinose transferase-like glycosyltransferase